MYKSYSIGQQFILTIGKFNSALTDFLNKKIYHIKNIISERIVNHNLRSLPNQLSNILSSDIVSDMEEIENYSFSKDFLYSSSKLWLDITSICNLRCKGCYAAQYMKDIKRKYLNIDMVETVADIGHIFHSIHLLGGEPLLHSSLRNILDKLIPKFDIIMIYTNGTHVTDALLLLVRNYTNLRLKISLYGINSGDHDNFTQTVGSFDTTMKSIIRCSEYGIRPNVTYLITNTARERDINRIQKFLGSINVDYGIDIERSYKSSDINLDNCEDYKNHNKFFNFKRREQYISNLFFHPCVRNKIGFDVNGRAYVCPMYRKDFFGELESNSIKDIIHNVNFMWKMSISNKYEDCSVCEFRALCFDCLKIDPDKAACPTNCKYDPHTGKYKV